MQSVNLKSERNARAEKRSARVLEGDKSVEDMICTNSGKKEAKVEREDRRDTADTARYLRSAKKENGTKKEQNCGASKAKADRNNGAVDGQEKVEPDDKGDSGVSVEVSDCDSEPVFERREMPIRYSRSTRYYTLLDIVKAGGSICSSAMDSYYYGGRMWEESESDDDWDPGAIYGANANELLKCNESVSSSDSEEEEEEEKEGEERESNEGSGENE